MQQPSSQIFRTKAKTPDCLSFFFFTNCLSGTFEALCFLYLSFTNQEFYFKKTQKYLLNTRANNLTNIYLIQKSNLILQFREQNAQVHQHRKECTDACPCFLLILQNQHHTFLCSQALRQQKFYKSEKTCMAMKVEGIHVKILKNVRTAEKRVKIHIFTYPNVLKRKKQLLGLTYAMLMVGTKNILMYFLVA